MADAASDLSNRVPLAVKIAVPVVAATTLLVATAGTIAVAVVQAQIEAAYDRETESIAMAVEAMYLQHPEDPLQIDAFLTRLDDARPDLVNVRIHGIDPQGTVIASSDPTEVGATDLLDRAQLQAVRQGVPYEEFIGAQDINVVPLKDDQDFVFGAIVITSSSAPEDAAIARATIDVGLIAAASIVTELIFLLPIVYFAVLRRARRLQRAVAAVERGDTSVRLPEGQEPPGRDEMFNLSRRVDLMIASLVEQQRHGALIRRLGQRALEGTPAFSLVAEGLEALRETLKLESAMFVRVDERGRVLTALDHSGTRLDAGSLPLWVGALTAVAVSGRQTVVTDRLGQGSRFVDSSQSWTAQALIVPLARTSKAGEAIVAIAASGVALQTRELAVLDAVAATFAEALHMQEADDARAESAVKSRVMAAVSHEMRNPLNSILGFTALVLNNGKETLTEKQRRQLGYVQTSANNMLTLVNNYLDLAKTRSGSLQLQTEVVNVAPLVEEVVTLMQPAAAARNVTIRAATTATVASRLDPVRTRQVLTNLISNAVKFTPAGGRVFVRARADASACRLVVSDTGVGIPKEQKKMIFDEFARINAGAQASAKGTGLGLALTRAIVEAMGGTIRFYSRQGRGTTFVVVLPGSGETKTAAA